MFKKRSFQVLLFFCFLFALFPSGKKEISDIEQNGKSEKALYIISLPESGDLGSFFNVKFKAARKIEKAWITIYDTSEKKIQTINAFPLDKTEKEWAAIAAVAVWWKSGKWKIRTHLIIDRA